MIQFKLRALIAQKEQLEGGRVTYRDIQEATGINLNTLTAMANNDMKQVHLSTVERLCDYFGCSIEQLMVLDDEVDPQQKFRRQLYEKLGKQLDPQRLLPEQWSLPGHLDDVIRIEISGLPKDEIRSLFYIGKDDTLYVGVSIKTRDRQKNQDIFDRLATEKKEIEAVFGHPLLWENPAHIRYKVPHSYLGRQNEWPAIQTKMIATWERLIEAFKSPLHRLWAAYEPVIKQEFPLEHNLIQSNEEELLVTIDNKIKEYTTVIRCDICVRQGDQKILRNKLNLPQPGHIGLRYEQHRVLLIAQNPGYAKPQRTQQHQKYAEAERTFLESPTRSSMETLQNTLEQAMSYWTIYNQILASLLSNCGLTLADIAFFNAVRCPTISNQLPSATMVENCQTHLKHWLDWLRPRVVICIGKMAYQEVTPILTARQIPHAYFNRDRRLSAGERAKNLEEVGQFVRSILSDTGLMPVSETIVPASAGKLQASEPTDQLLTVEERQALDKMKSEELQDIYMDLIDFSKNLNNVAARQITSGSKSSFRYFDSRGKYDFSFIVNQYDLLFYIRGLALRQLPTRGSSFASRWGRK